MLDYVKTIKKTYKDHNKYIEYNQAWKPSSGKKRKSNEKSKEEIINNRDQNIKDLRNIIRAKTAISDIISCNTFNYFVTLTIAPNGTIDRYDYDSSSNAITKYLKHNISKYILVPEKHKDGAFHFHLLADIDKIHLKKFKKNYYNLTSYKLGFSSAVSITSGSESRLASYVQKYITKDLITTVKKGRKRYWCSRGLIRPTVTYNEPPPPFFSPVFERKDIKVYITPLEETSQHL